MQNKRSGVAGAQISLCSSWAETLQSLRQYNPPGLSLFWLENEILDVYIASTSLLRSGCLGQYAVMGAGDGASHLEGLHAGPPGAHQRVAGAAWRQLVHGGECEEGSRGGI